MDQNHWDLRKGLVVKAIQHFNPDLLGTQETHPFQAKYLVKSFPEHAYYGVGRMEDPKTGEQCGVMFRKERFKLLDKGTFWLSETLRNPVPRVGIRLCRELQVGLSCVTKTMSNKNLSHKYTL